MIEELVKNAKRTGAQSVPVAMSVASARKSRYYLRHSSNQAFFRAEATLIASEDACAPVRSALRRHL